MCPSFSGHNFVFIMHNASMLLMPYLIFFVSFCAEPICLLYLHLYLCVLLTNSITQFDKQNLKMINTRHDLAYGSMAGMAVRQGCIIASI